MAKKTKHHRKAKANNGGNDKANISKVNDKHHKAFHLLFGTGSPFEVAKILNDKWLDPAYELVVRRKNG